MAHALTRVLYRSLLRRTREFDKQPVLKYYYQQIDPSSNQLLTSYVALVRSKFRETPVSNTKAISEAFLIYRQLTEVYRQLSSILPVLVKPPPPPPADLFSNTKPFLLQSPTPAQTLSLLAPSPSDSLSLSPSESQSPSESPSPSPSLSLSPSPPQPSSILPLFFYKFLAFPGITLTLHLYEPRYKIMVGKMLSGSIEKKFGFVTDFTTDSGHLGIIADVLQIHPFDNGEAAIVVKLGKRFVLPHYWPEADAEGLLFGDCLELADEKISTEDEAALKKEALENMRLLLSFYLRMFRRTTTDFEREVGKSPTEEDSLDDILWWTLNLFVRSSVFRERDKLEILKSTSSVYRAGEIRRIVKHFFPTIVLS